MQTSVTLAGTTSSDFADFVLNALRCDALRTCLQTTEADTIGIALRAGWIDVTTAITWANEFGLLGVISVSSGITSVSSSA
jgi:hypothetical protein